jgi:hypothetical protein
MNYAKNLEDYIKREKCEKKLCKTELANLEKVRTIKNEKTYAERNNPNDVKKIIADFSKTAELKDKMNCMVNKCQKETKQELNSRLVLSQSRLTKQIKNKIKILLSKKISEKDYQIIAKMISGLSLKDNNVTY